MNHGTASDGTPEPRFEAREGVESFWQRMVEEHHLKGKLTFPALLARTARLLPDKPALVFEDRRYSYRLLFEAIAGVARHLRTDLGVKADDTVALLLENSDLYNIWYLAVLATGAVGVPLNTRLTAREIEFILADSGVSLLLSEERFSDTIKDLAPAVLTRLKVERLAREHQPEPSSWDLVGAPVSIEAPAAIYYTSGTTGQPKGVVHTHRSLVAGALQGVIGWEYEDESVVNLATTPLFHIANHTIYLPTLLVGGTLVIDTYNTERAFLLIEQHRITQVFAVPSILLLMTQFPERDRYDTSSVIRVLFGAAPMPVGKLKAVQAVFPNAALLHGMGQTECCGTTVVLPSHLAFEKAGSVGINMPGTEIRIVDDTDQELPPKAVGELVTRGPNVMSHYLNRPEATAETLRNGWLHTGDLGYRDEEGYVYLVDRKKDLIIRGGENIYSTEVEQALYMMPEIAQVAVIGAPSELFGEEVVACVVKKECSGALTLAQIQAHCSRYLAEFKVPVDVHFLSELPQTATGKIQKAALKEMLGIQRAGSAFRE
ncbi:MAG: AMP-binding protein [Burkholderiaceae bacterium]|jgi:acyl-CoA synthetase (AMP-forming)/AMP-acid ligase II|nr:AMP-binding protein [Burkholderiaceae bacterium]